MSDALSELQGTKESPAPPGGAAVWLQGCLFQEDSVWLFGCFVATVVLFFCLFLMLLQTHFLRNEFVPVKEGKTFPHLVEVLLNLLVHLCRFSLSHNHNRYYLTTGAQGFKKFIQQVQSFFTPSEDEDVIPIPHTTFGLAPTIHGRTDPFHLRSATEPWYLYNLTSQILRMLQ